MDAGSRGLEHLEGFRGRMKPKTGASGNDGQVRRHGLQECRIDRIRRPVMWGLENFTSGHHALLY
jgi:hypothetical protein